MPVPIEEASRFGILITDEHNRITEFEEKPAVPRSNLASMGIYIFSWPVLKEALIKMKDEPGCDFIPEFNLYEEYWKIYTKSDVIPPQYIASDAHIERSIVGEGTEVYGDVINSVIGAGVTIAKGAVVKDSIVMQGSVIGAGTSVEKAIIAENVKVGSDVQIGVGEYAPSTYDQKVYQFDLATIGENSIIPDGVKIGKNTAIAGETTVGDYPDGLLASGNYIIKAGGVK